MTGSLKTEVTSQLGTETVRVLVGKEQTQFTLHKKLLCETSSYFRENLDATPAGLSNSTNLSSSSSDAAGTVLWFSDETCEMFELFIMWLYKRSSFRSALDQAILKLAPRRRPHAEDEARRQELHWNIVRLHLFAALIDLPSLQDTGMDALQDMYLRYDWDITPRFVSFLYGPRCSAESAFRLRNWAVAMIAWTLYGGYEHGLAKAGRFQRLFDRQPELFEDYCAHLQKMNQSGADISVKNPQLRLPRNRLRSEERFFGFRQCSFHSHRSAVGEGACPHSLPSGGLKIARGSRPTPRKTSSSSSSSSVSSSPKSSSPYKDKRLARLWNEDGEVIESDESDADHGILKPVSEEKVIYFAGVV